MRISRPLPPLQMAGRQRHRARPHVTEQWVIVSRQVARQKARRLLEPQAGRREEFSEEGVALAVLTPPRWIDGAVKEMCPKTNIAKQDEPVHADKPHVVPPGAGSRKDRDRLCVCHGAEGATALPRANGVDTISSSSHAQP